MVALGGRSRVLTLLVTVGLWCATSCTSDAPDAAAPADRSSRPASGTPDTGSPPAVPGGPRTSSPDGAVPPVPRRISLQRLMNQEYDGGRLRVLRRTDYGSYTRSEVSYRSAGLTVTGILNRPHGEGPFPALVLAHGYIEPSVYVTGQGLSREQDHLARAGYVVLHVDYRGHAGSDPGRAIDRETRLGYTEDVINAVRALRSQRYVDRDRIGLLGRSMGGGIVYNVLVAQPHLVDAAVVYAPVSSRFLDNFDRWIRRERPDVAAAFMRRFGSRSENPAFYRDLSPRTFFERIRAPLLLHHGTADESCPLRWSRSTVRALERAGKRARLVVYPGEPHAFGAAWPGSMRSSVRFLGRHL
jgi:dipeptidyl aminopeptidase/acylaminoacyl peptidase